MSGNICHFDIPSKDIKESGVFYSKVFGWKLDANSFPGYGLLELPKEPHGGIEKRDPFSPGVMIYIQVDEVTEALKMAKEAGGAIVKEKTEIPNVGWFGIFSDPDGNVLGVFQGRG